MMKIFDKITSVMMISLYVRGRNSVIKYVIFSLVPWQPSSLITHMVTLIFFAVCIDYNDLMRRSLLSAKLISDLLTYREELSVSCDGYNMTVTFDDFSLEHCFWLDKAFLQIFLL